MCGDIYGYCTVWINNIIDFFKIVNITGPVAFYIFNIFFNVFEIVIINYLDIVMITVNVIITMLSPVWQTLTGDNWFAALVCYRLTPRFTNETG